MSRQQKLDLLNRWADDRPGPRLARASTTRMFLDRIPHTASTGPATSQDAGDEHHDSGRRETNAMRVLRMVWRWPDQQATVFHRTQMVQFIGVDPPPTVRTLHLQEIRRRLTDLQALGYVEKGQRRGREYTWRITLAGELHLSKTVGPLAR